MLERILAEPELVETYRGRARERARRYSWDAVSDEYERLLTTVVAMAGPGSLPPELLDGEALSAPGTPQPASAPRPSAT
jgi:hypothetical protein